MPFFCLRCTVSDDHLISHSSFPWFCRPVWSIPLCSQRPPVTRCTVGRWCQSCCSSATASRTSPTAWTACTVSTTVTLTVASVQPTPASFCPRDTTALTSCLSSTAGEDSHKLPLYFMCLFSLFVFVLFWWAFLQQVFWLVIVGSVQVEQNNINSSSALYECDWEPARWTPALIHFTGAVAVPNLPLRNGLFTWPVAMLAAVFFLKLLKWPAVIEPQQIKSTQNLMGCCCRALFACSLKSCVSKPHQSLHGMSLDL